MKIAICDNDIVYTELLLEKASHVLPASEFSVFSSGRDFLKCFLKAPEFFDAVILDIELEPGSPTGIALAQQINRCNPQVQIIFISQYLEYAPQAYAANHIWYVDKKRLDEFLPAALKTAAEKNASYNGKFLPVKEHQTWHQIPQEKICYLEKNLHETKIHTRNDRFTTRQKMSELLAQLPPYFVVCHRSYAVNLKAVTDIRRESIKLQNGQEVPVSRTYYQNVKTAFSRLFL